MPAGSKTDPPLAKAKPISHGGSASGIMYLRRGEKNCARPTAAEREEQEYVRETTLQTPRSVQKEGQEVLQVPEQRFPCSLVRQAVPLQPTEVHGGADIHLQPMEDPMLEQVDALEGRYDPMKSLHWNRLLAGPVAP
ncbi:AN1-type zinc finger protein 5-like [Grus japonensis]|uniref:AN1-type zinc finger protein 5-like n=1 Tax=Grus japonensis TaxID=30415 RepID=A0ABC9WTT7_GRUJA